MNGKDLLIEIEEEMNSYDKYDMMNGGETNCTRPQSCDHCDCSDEYYSTLEEDQQWRYVEGLDVNNELDNLNHEIESKAQKRKDTPVFSGVLKYFPNALKEVARCSKAGNDQHHPEKPLHWDMDKSKDEYDALTRHLMDHTIDPLDDDGVLHLTKVAWRSLAGLERYLTGKD